MKDLFAVWLGVLTMIFIGIIIYVGNAPTIPPLQGMVMYTDPADPDSACPKAFNTGSECGVPVTATGSSAAVARGNALRKVDCSNPGSACTDPLECKESSSNPLCSEAGGSCEFKAGSSPNCFKPGNSSYPNVRCTRVGTSDTYNCTVQCRCNQECECVGDEPPPPPPVKKCENDYVCSNSSIVHTCTPQNGCYCEGGKDIDTAKCLTCKPPGEFCQDSYECCKPKQDGLLAGCIGGRCEHFMPSPGPPPPPPDSKEVCSCKCEESSDAPDGFGRWKVDESTCSKKDPPYPSKCNDICKGFCNLTNTPKECSR